MHTRHITAVSLHPLPAGPAIREAVEAYLAASPRPSDVLRQLADLMDAGEVPPLSQPVHEAGEWLDDYRNRVNRKTYRCTEDHARDLAAMARATGLSQTSIIRLALASCPVTVVGEPFDSLP